MQHLKKMNEYFSPEESEFGKFMGLNIRDIYKIDFYWSNEPFFGDYRVRFGKYGDADSRIALTNGIKIKLRDTTKEEFEKTLIEYGFDVKYPGVINKKDYSVELKGQDIVEFFNLVENY